MYRRRVAVVFLVVVMSTMLFGPSYINVPSVEAVGETWLTGWSYRKSHTIANATGAGANYQVKVIVINGSAADSGNTTYINKTRSDFGDVRFTDDDGSMLLDYWMETLNTGVNATFWVEVTDSLELAAQTIYIYYGNSGVTTTSNGVDTFVFFDDFGDSSIDPAKWTAVSGTVTESTGYEVADLTLRPNAAGTYQLWTRVGGATHWGVTSDQADVTYLYTTNTADRETENLEDSALSAGINSVTAYIRAKAFGLSTVESAVIVWRINSTNYESTATAISRVAFTDYSQIRNTNPNTTLAWTWTDINALEVGARASTLAGGDTEEIDVSEIWVVINYNSAAGTGYLTLSGTSSKERSNGTLPTSIRARYRQRATLTDGWDSGLEKSDNTEHSLFNAWTAHLEDYNGTLGFTAWTPLPAANTFHIYELDWIASTSTCFYLNDVFLVTHTTYIPITVTLLVLGGESSLVLIAWDWAFVAKYVTPEPMHDAWGGEEASPTIGVSSGTNWDDTDNLYAQKKTYTVSVTYSDADGFADIHYCELYLKTSANVTRAQFRFHEDDNTWWHLDGTTQWTQIGYSNASTGNNIAVVWGFQAKWNSTEESDLDFLFFVVDADGAAITSVTDENFDVVTRLVTSGFTNDDSRINIADTTTINGTAYYGNDPAINVASTSYPPDAEFTQIDIHDSGGNVVATDNVVVNGYFSTSFTIPNAAQSNTYHAWCYLADAEGTDQDFVDGDTTAVIGDNLTITNFQPVQYLGSGNYKYEAQLKYGYDLFTINGGYAVLAYPNGTVVGKVSSNATGWVTFIVGQLNSTSGAFNIYGENETLWSITYPGLNQTFANYYWTLAPQDVTGNSLTNTTYSVTVGATVVWSGITAVYVPTDTFNLTVTWLQDLAVNSTVNIVIAGDTTTNLNCTCYPYIIGATRYWVASNGTITSAVYASYLLTVEFSCAPASYVLVASYTTRPSYVLNVTYDYTTAFAPGYLVMPHFGNTTLVASYENWAGLYVKKTDRLMLSVSWAGQRLDIVTNGTTGDSGELDVYCSSRGAPSSDSGFTVTSYVGGVFIGLYTFASPHTGSLEWTPASSGGSTGGPSAPASLFITLAFSFPETVQSGATVDGFLNVSWMGAATVYIWSVVVDSDYAREWEIQVARLPWTLETLMQNGRAQVPVVLYITGSLVAGNYSVPCDVTFHTVEGVSKTVRSILTFEVSTPVAEVPSTLVYVFLIGIGLVVTSGLFLGTQKRRKYSQ